MKKIKRLIKNIRWLMNNDLEKSKRVINNREDKIEGTGNWAELKKRFIVDP